MKLYMFILSSILFLSGCASTLEFTKDVKKSDWLYDDESEIEKYSNYKIEDLIKKMGSDKTGYIPQDSDVKWLEFQSQYPPSIPTEKDIEALKSSGFNNRVSQVIRLSADLDRRTYGVVKNEGRTPISVSGLLDVGWATTAQSAALAGSSQLIAANTSSSSLINPTQSTLANVGAGLFAGFAAGAIAKYQIESSRQGIISANDFGSRMEETTFLMTASGGSIISKYATYGGNHATISPGIIKTIWKIASSEEPTVRTRVFLVSTIGIWRGENYKAKYPKTMGWEFSITNINSIVIKNMPYGKEYFEETIQEIRKNNIKL